MSEEVRLLQKKFKETGHTLISEFLRSTNSELSQEVYGRILKRDQAPGLLVLLKAAGELGCTPEEIRQMLLARGEKVLARLIAPTAISQDDQLFLDRLHQLKGDPKKLKLVMDLLDSLG